MNNLIEKSCDQTLVEAYDYFKNQGLSILGEGYKEIASNPVLFEGYVDALTDGMNANDAATMAQLMANSNAHTLKESSITGIQPVASLSMPVIRKLWPKFALKEAITTEVAKTPRFVVTYTAPYMFKGEDIEENRIYLPRDLKTGKIAKDLIHEGLKKSMTAEKIVALDAGAAVVVDFSEDPAVRIANTPSAAKLQPLDELFYEVLTFKVTADTTAVAGKVYYDDAKGQVVSTVEAGTTPVNGKYEVASRTQLAGKRLGVYGNGMYKFGTAGQVMVQFDGANRKATFAAIGEAIVLAVKAAVSTEYNEDSYSVSFDIKRQDIDIPTGQHLNAALPIERLTDLMALYQIDGTKETVNLMTNVFAQKLDLETLQFIKESHLNQPSNEAFAEDHFAGVNEFTYVFDCKPAAGFAGSPKAWREELKPLIDYLAQKIKNQTLLGAGVFTIIGNPLDVQLLANVDWQFRSGQGGNVDGVAVDYSVGTYVGANTYKVISSTNVPAGQFFIVFNPSDDTQMTYKYYPYMYATELGYVDPNRSRTPSIMLTKRHTFYEFMPAVGCVVILNNNGKDYFAKSTNWMQVDDHGNYKA